MVMQLFWLHRPGVVLMVMLSMICPQVSGEAYLPVVGPVPLRFETAAVHVRTFSWIPPVAVKPAAPAQTNPPPKFVAIPDKIARAVPLLTAKTNETIPPLPENLSTNSTVETHSANDLLVVTPEMLVDYFKPGTVATNQTPVRALAPVGFMPPPSVASPSSEAIYRSQ